MLTDKFEPVASVRMDLVIDLAEEIGREYPQLLSLVVNLQRPALSQEPMQSSLTAFLHEWLRTNDGTKDNGERLAEIRKELNDGTVYTATLGLLTFYSDAILPSQWHSSLIAILRATIQQPTAGETLNQRLVRQLQTTLAEYFGNREELLKFLRDEFPAIEHYLQEGDNYSNVLNDAAEAFEREGQTEDLLSILKQRANSISVTAVAGTVQLISSGTVDTGGGAYIGAIGHDVRRVDTGGGAYIGAPFRGEYVGGNKIEVSNIYRTVLSILPQEIPESLVLVSPILTTMHIDPDALFNWAAAMRAVTRTIARFDTVKGYLSGFLIAPDLVMTLNFDQTDEELGKSKLRFQHILSTSISTFENPTLYSLEKRPPLWVNKRLRCAIFQIAGTPGTDLIPLTDVNRGWLRLAKQPPNPGDYACCVHFPGGESLRLSSALVTHDAERKIKLTLLDKQLMMQYGSIGAPWFNQRWEVIGLHLGIRPTKQKESNSATMLSVSWLDRLLSNKEFAAILNKHIPADEKPIHK